MIEPASMTLKAVEREQNAEGDQHEADDDAGGEWRFLGSFMSVPHPSLRSRSVSLRAFSANGALPPANADLRRPMEPGTLQSPRKHDDDHRNWAGPRRFMICPKCQTPNPEPAENCLHCGFAFAGVPLAERVPPRRADVAADDGRAVVFPAVGRPVSARRGLGRPAGRSGDRPPVPGQEPAGHGRHGRGLPRP